MEIYFRLNLSFEQFLPYYQGAAAMVEVRDMQGRLLHIHGRHLRPYLTPSGVQGLFRMTLNKHGELLSLTKIE